MDLSYFNDPETGELASRPETKTLADVERVIHKHKGNNDAAVDKFIDMYLAGLQWDWYEEYQSYLIAKAEVEEWNNTKAGTVSHTESVRVVTGEGDNAVISYEEREVLHEAKTLPVEPVRPPLLTVEQWKAQSSSYNSYAKMRGVEFQGVMCSATAADQWGLGSIKEWIRAGNATVFNFENGSKLTLTQANLGAFEAVWIPFRASFFS